MVDEAISKELEAFFVHMNDFCFGRMQREATLGGPRMHHFQRLFGFFASATLNDRSSSPGELHPQALTEPDVNLSVHPALIVQSWVGFHEPITQRVEVLAEPHGPASEPPCADGFVIV